jgi:hypothetical protein
LITSDGNALRKVFDRARAFKPGAFQFRPTSKQIGTRIEGLAIGVILETGHP